jgi:hypothetical protein
MTPTDTDVTLPEGESLQRIGQVLLDAWEVGFEQWDQSSSELRETHRASRSAPVPQDALAFFRLLHERRVPYLLVGGVAMLIYVRGRNTKDLDLLMSLEAIQQFPELEIREQSERFVRGRFRSLQVDLLLTSHPLFKTASEQFATRHRFAELNVATATVEGLIVLKLYALPSIYRQMDLDKTALYENDITMLLARHSPKIGPLLNLVEQHVTPGDVAEVRKIADECALRATRMRQRMK